MDACDGLQASALLAGELNQSDSGAADGKLVFDATRGMHIRMSSPVTSQPS